MLNNLFLQTLHFWNILSTRYSKLGSEIHFTLLVIIVKICNKLKFNVQFMTIHHILI